MISMKHGGPAFPRPLSDDITQDGSVYGDRPERSAAQDGMSLRQYYAAKFVPAVFTGMLENLHIPVGPELYEAVTSTCFGLSDKMLEFEQEEAEARSKGSSDDTDN